MTIAHREPNVLGLTASLAAAVAGLSDDDVPASVHGTVRRGLTDCVGVMIAGSSEPVVSRVRDALGALGPDEARLLPGGERCSARSAALINGIAGHVLDYDDVALDGHPSAVLVPALLAEGEAIGAPVRDLLRAYVAGYETWATLWRASPEPLHARGWHPSGVFGTVAAAAACAALRRLGTEETSNALGLAAAQSAGLIANFGSMAKSFQVGRAAEAGILSARLAAGGVDASPRAVEHKSGFLRAFSGRERPITGCFGRPDWAILTDGLDIKTYPVCYATHRLIDAALQLHREERVAPAEMSTIEIHVGRIQSEMLHSRRPGTVLEAKFSCEFAVAASLVAGRVGMAELTEDFVLRTDIQQAMDLCERFVDDAIGEPPFSPADRVAVHLRDGRRFDSRPVRHASGSRHAPPARDEAWTKFADVAGRCLAQGPAKRLFDTLWDLDPERPIRTLFESSELRSAA